MAKVSKETATGRISLDGLDVWQEHFEGGYSVCFESHTADADLAPLFRGLPDDRCQVPRLGYVVAGSMTFRFADREETYRAGDAYYVPPGHTPVHHAGAGDRGVQPHRRAHEDAGHRHGQPERRGPGGNPAEAAR